jgi:hypothetical protein
MDCGRRGGIGTPEQAKETRDPARRGERKVRRGNGNGRTHNDSLHLTALISSRDDNDFYCIASPYIDCDLPCIKMSYKVLLKL